MNKAQSVAVKSDLDPGISGSAQKGFSMTNKILRLPAVRERIGLSRSTIYLRIAEGSFPRPVTLGARAVGWLESDIEEWVRQKIELSRRSL